MLSPICLTKNSSKGLLFFNSIVSSIKENSNTKLMHSYYFIDTNGPLSLFSSPRKTFANSSFFPKNKIVRKALHSHYLTKTHSIITTEDKKCNKQDKDKGKDNKRYPMLSNMSSSSMFPFKKKMREKVDLVNFLTEAKKKKYVREIEKDQQKIKTKVAETTKKIRLMKSMCDFIYPYILKVKEDRIQNEIDCIKSKGMKIRREKSVLLPGCIPVKTLYTQKAFHNRIHFYTNIGDKERKSNKA